MALMVGAVLAVVVGVFGTTVRLDRDRAFYPVVTIVVASYYVLYAAMADSSRALLVESLVALVFVACAVWGFRRSLWITAAALAGHGIFDQVHGAIIANPGVPTFWPSFCLGYDVVAGAYLAWLLRGGRVAANPAP